MWDESTGEVLKVIQQYYTVKGIDGEIARGAAIVALTAADHFTTGDPYKLCKRSEGCGECNPLARDNYNEPVEPEGK